MIHRRLALVFAFPALTLSAQAPPGADTARLNAIARIRVGSLVRLDARGGGRHIGPLLAYDRETISLGRDPTLIGRDQPSVAVAVVGIDSLWVRGRAAGTGATAGAVIGGIGLGAVTGALVRAFDETGSCEDCVEAVVVGGALGAAGGALLGALIGSAFPKWHRRFP